MILENRRSDLTLQMTAEKTYNLGLYHSELLDLVYAVSYANQFNDSNERLTKIYDRLNDTFNEFLIRSSK